MKASEIISLISMRDHLIEVAGSYIMQRKRLKHSPEHIQITEIKFVCCSDKEETFKFNSHHVIDSKPFLDSIDKEIENIKYQICKIEEKLPMVEFETKIAE